MSLGVVRAGCGHSRQAVMVAGSQLAMSQQFALQLQCPQLLNAQTWGTQGTSKEHQTVLKILYSLENTAFSTVCSAPPSFNPPTARFAEVKATSARSPPQQESRGQVSLTPFPSSQGGGWLSSPRWYPAARHSPPKPPVKPNSQCQAQPLELMTALGGWGCPRGEHVGAVMLPRTRIWGSPCDF